jgi:Transposase, Mutator family
MFGGDRRQVHGERTWRKVKSDWDAWNARSLAGEPIVRLILDGTVVRVRLDRKATSISLLTVLGVRTDGQKVLLAIKSMGGERRGLAQCARRPHQAWAAAARVPHYRRRAGARQAIAAVWAGVPVQRCTVHKHRNLLAQALGRPHDEITADYNDMIDAATPQEIEVAARSSSANGGSSIAPRQPGRSRRTLVRLYPAAAKPMAQRAHHECDRAVARSSNEGSRGRPCCRRPISPRCCSGRCSPPVRSTCASWMAGRRSPPSPSISRLTIVIDGGE